MTGPNEAGFITSAPEASVAADYCGRQDVGPEPGFWGPWLVVEYALFPRRRRDVRQSERQEDEGSHQERLGEAVSLMRAVVAGSVVPVGWAPLSDALAKVVAHRVPIHV